MLPCANNLIQKKRQISRNLIPNIIMYRILKTNETEKLLELFYLYNEVFEETYTEPSSDYLANLIKKEGILFCVAE
jgi:hypothetical protein